MADSTRLTAEEKNILEVYDNPAGMQRIRIVLARCRRYFDSDALKMAYNAGQLHEVMTAWETLEKAGRNVGRLTERERKQIARVVRSTA